MYNRAQQGLYNPWPPGWSECQLYGARAPRRGSATSGAARFNHALVGLDKQGSYEILKEHLIRCLSMSGAIKLNHVLRKLTLGDRTPSQLLREMKQLAGCRVTPALLQSLWLQRFPEGTRAILACANFGSLTKSMKYTRDPYLVKCRATHRINSRNLPKPLLLSIQDEARKTDRIPFLEIGARVLGRQDPLEVPEYAGITEGSRKKSENVPDSKPW